MRTRLSGCWRALAGVPFAAGDRRYGLAPRVQVVPLASLLPTSIAT